MRKSAPLFCALLLSLSARRAWIEILVLAPLAARIASLSARRAWIEINRSSAASASPKSLSARRAWIEIWHCLPCPAVCRVALRKESVDRNRTPHHRNTRPMPSLSARRAWIEIACEMRCFLCLRSSLSARRAWIEITQGRRVSGRAFVALRKESVDRNFFFL